MPSRAGHTAVCSGVRWETASNCLKQASMPVFLSLCTSFSVSWSVSFALFGPIIGVSPPGLPLPLPVLLLVLLLSWLLHAGIALGRHPPCIFFPGPCLVLAFAFWACSFWALCEEWGRDPTFSFPRWLPSFFHTISWIICLFHTDLKCHFCHALNFHMYMSAFLGPVPYQRICMLAIVGVCVCLGVFWAMLYGLWDLPWPGIEPKSWQWKPRILTTWPPRNSCHCIFLSILFLYIFIIYSTLLFTLWGPFDL